MVAKVWSTGQDQMRIVKQRLLEMIPDLKVFLDVDDLEDTAALERYISESRLIFIYASKDCALPSLTPGLWVLICSICSC